MTHDDLAARTIVQTRRISAPPRIVFDAWTKPEHLARWWGPDGYTTTILAMDFREGGLLRFVMHGPDGTDYDNRIAYRRIAAPERLEYIHGSDRADDPNAFDVTVTFEDRDGATQLTMRSVFPSAEMVEAVKSFWAVELGQQTLAKLDAFVQAL